MKKKIIILVALLLVIVLCFSTYYIYLNVKSNNICNKDVQTAIDDLFNSKEYKDMEYSDQVEAMSDLLYGLEKCGNLKDVDFEEEGGLFSFTYNSGKYKGTLGGIKLKPFPEGFN